jgi:hypothetical protein
MIGFIRGNWWRAGAIATGAACAALFAIVLFQRAEIASHVGARNTAAQALLAAQGALETTAARIRAASAEATATALDNALTVERREAAVSRKVETHVQDRLGGIAARLDGLRKAAADRAPAGGARPACVPTPAGAIACPDGAIASDGVLVSPEVLAAAQHAAEVALGWQMWWRELSEAGE